jgi:hypothetical protein
LGRKALGVHGKPKLTENEKGETGEEQSQEHAHHFSLTSKTFGDRRTGCCITTNYQLILPSSSGNIFYQKHDCHPHPPYFSVSLIEDKAERSPF